MAKPFLDFRLRAITPLYFPLQQHALNRTRKDLFSTGQQGLKVSGQTSNISWYGEEREYYSAKLYRRGLGFGTGNQIALTGYLKHLQEIYLSEIPLLPLEEKHKIQIISLFFLVPELKNTKSCSSEIQTQEGVKTEAFVPSFLVLCLFLGKTFSLSFYCTVASRASQHFFWNM